jgi:signal transduction histidine kinase
MTLRAGSQLHTMFWPSTFTDVITTSTALRLAFTAIVLAGGALELHRIAVERAAMLAAEQEHSNRLAELTVLKADFTAMVAHELSGPLTAIARLSEMASHFDDRTVRSQALQGIQAEIAMLRSLVSDVQLTAAVERDDFLVSPQPDGAPVELRAVAEDGVVRIEIVDQGYGIHANDLRRIFEKFGRGRDLGGRPVTGVGVGLYLSRRIVQAHGSELHVHSRPGAGSTFSFTLEMVDRTGNRF